MALTLKGPAAMSRALAFVLAVFAAATAHANAPIKPWTGGSTPRLALEDVDGRKVDLAVLRSRVVLVNFWATWCEPCREEMASLERLRAKMKGRPFEVLAVNYGESAATTSAFVSKLRISLPVLLDPFKKAAGDWKVRGLPMTFLVDARGRVRYWSFGESDWSAGEPMAVIERMLGEAPRAGR